MEGRLLDIVIEREVDESRGVIAIHDRHDITY